MTKSNSTTHDDLGILNIAEGRMRAAQAKWSRLSQEDISSIREKDDLIAKVQERYSLPRWVAVQDVELWARATVSRLDPGQGPRR
jgi:hypothetical protein